MRLPGFTAESSLRKVTRAYRAMGFYEGSDTQPTVRPASLETMIHQYDFIFTDGTESTPELMEANFLFDAEATY